MRLLLSREAEADLEQIGDHIARDNPGRALSFVLELRERAGKLLSAPQAYPLVPRYEAGGVRRCVHGNYLIFYRLNGPDVEVLRVIHGAMDYEQLLFPE
ncbi:type II toxin-antitoxin system RelE/ParE family toxin [Xanthobacter wiegelii]|uniref:type II toxin-antitoxin system RelE/ParE family toxin n=1 Tax=Xanthobacter wiegelii TaxID=3119913 RepID=UPI0037285710